MRDHALLPQALCVRFAVLLTGALCGAACGPQGTSSTHGGSRQAAAPSASPDWRDCGELPCTAASPAEASSDDPYAPFSLVPKLDYTTGLLGDIPVPALFQIIVSPAEAPSAESVPAACKAVPKAITIGAASVGCQPAKGGGAWLVFTKVTRSDGGERGVWKVGFWRDGRVAWGNERAYERLPNEDSAGVPPQAASVGDLDGDGTEDVALWAYEPVNSSDVGERTVTVYTLDRGKPKQLPFFEKHASFALRDCDGQGRAEAYYDPYRSYGSAQGLSFVLYNRRTSPAWSLLAELTPQGPVQDGTLARAYAARLCSDVTEAPLIHQRPGAWPHVIHCRKLRGAKAATIERELTPACANASGSLEMFCRLNREPLLKMIRTELPLTLTGSDAPAPEHCLLPPVAPD